VIDRSMTQPATHASRPATQASPVRCGRRFGYHKAQAQRLITAINTLVYRLTDGRVAGRFFGAPVLLLHTVGRRTGRLRITPLCYVSDEDRLVLVGSNGGTASDPAWLHNLRARPRALVRVGDDSIDVTAREAHDSERERLWQRAVEMYPGYAGYQRRTDRPIPVIVLEPAPSHTQHDQERAEDVAQA
jgi:F420H(2)-dependent quinone reductase